MELTGGHRLGWIVAGTGTTRRGMRWGEGGGERNCFLETKKRVVLSPFVPQQFGHYGSYDNNDD